MPDKKQILECKILKHFLQKELEGETNAGEAYSIYSSQAEIADLPDISTVLSSMSTDEKRHYQNLTEMLAELETICPE